MVYYIAIGQLPLLNNLAWVLTSSSKDFLFGKDKAWVWRTHWRMKPQSPRQVLHTEHVTDLDWQDAAKHVLPDLLHPRLHPSLSLTYWDGSSPATACMLVIHMGFSGVIWPPTDYGNPYQFELILIWRLCLQAWCVSFRFVAVQQFLRYTHPVPGQDWWAIGHVLIPAKKRRLRVSVAAFWIIVVWVVLYDWPGLNYCRMYALKIEEENPQGSS